MEIKMSIYSDKSQETLHLLRENPEWIARYQDYAEVISDNIEVLKERKASFHRWRPLYVYLTTSEMKKNGNVRFSLRYMGQEVGKIAVKDQILCYPAYENNRKNFGYAPDFQGEIFWNSTEAHNFRQFFSEKMPCRNDCGKRNDEHRYESLLLSHFEKREKEIPAFRNIRPVTVIPGVRFPMPTPISASNKTSVTYSGTAGGGIDIFTRAGIGKATHLNIMELKDENRKGEEPNLVIRQAIAYATFILRLLRSNSGEKWFRLFGFTSGLPDQIKVYATCVMPKGYCEDKSFSHQKIYVHQTYDKATDTPDDHSDIIELHYIYFEENNGTIFNAQTSLPHTGQPNE